jgi:hypothetical protein
MKVAIVGGFKYHLECAAFICELFPTNVVINLYYHEEYFGYVSYFQQLYPNLHVHTTFTTSDIMSNNIVIKLTSNDPILEDERIISILHLNEKQCRSSRYIAMSPFILPPFVIPYEFKNDINTQIKYIFPIYRGIRCDAHRQIITYIGCFQPDYLDDDLHLMITSLPEYEFYFISHGVDQRLFDAHPNVRCFPECGATELVELVSMSKYILHRHIHVSNFDRFSGALSIAVSHRKPLILSSYFAEVYGLPAITYDYMFCETVGKIREVDYEAELDRLDAFIENQTLKNKAVFEELIKVP